MNNLFKINNTTYLDPPKEYNNFELYPNFQIKVEALKYQLKQNILQGKSETYFKFGDGDYYFLNKIPKGSAKPGKRALNKPYSKINHKPFLDGYLQNDNCTSLITYDNLSKFYKMFNEEPDYPSEIIYGLTANKWVINNTTSKIGLIGAREKLNIIKDLMEYEQYKDYLGIDKFTDYIAIDQNFACDNLEKTKKNVRKQIEKSTSDLFLIGVGHVKSGLICELKKYKKAIYLDIGVGIDALAGLVNIYRPYFGEWTNFQISSKKRVYQKIDILINNFGSLGEIKYL